MIVGILGLSIALQFIAAVMAFRLIRLTGERWAWGFIAAAIMLMTIRRSISLFHMVVNGNSYKADVIAEVVALVISILMVIGIARIAPVFRSVRQAKEDAQLAEKEVRTLKEKLEARVTERTSQLEAANKELEAFSYSVSHDLRSPLRAIDGFSSILLENYSAKLDDEGKRLLGVVRDNTSHMGQLIDDILQFSRTGRAELASVVVDMDRLVRDVLHELRHLTMGSTLQVEIGHLPAVRGDSAMLRQVFVNLLTNAIKFSRTRDTPRIGIGAEVKERETVYYVKDNGVGFDLQHSDKMFGAFERLNNVNEFEGTGIGLAIVKRIVTRHGGRVWAEGKVNEGATIYFALPNKENDHE
ncbi:MAG: two-component sensor histidine kinase [Gammaproteobacteria bacterium]|nr:two-component sensor histidine kinase [Gammaproteobacteria bacterium]